MHFSAVRPAAYGRAMPRPAHTTTAHDGHSRDARLAAVPVISASSVQLGAAIGATLLPVLGPGGVVALRQLSAALVLLPFSRPRSPLPDRSTIALIVLLGIALVSMNLSVYSAIQRVGLGLAVTLEFLGPLALTIMGTRRRPVAIWGLMAGAGVGLLAGTAVDIDPVGIGFGLLAAASWAAYIVLNQRIAGRVAGIRGTAFASVAAAAITLPILLLALRDIELSQLWIVLAIGAAVGVLSSAFPYSLDLLVLRRMPRATFSVLQSVHPLAAALAGWLVLQQVLGALQIVGLVLVCAANVGTVMSARNAERSSTAPVLTRTARLSDKRGGGSE